MNKALIIFIKNPELGKVKTRLAKSIGDHKALEVYKLLMVKTQEVTEKVDVNRLLFYSNEINHNDNWSTTFFSKHLQHNGDLGEKMKNGFNDAFSLGNEKVIIIGSDCYDLTSEIIQQAFDALEYSDTVIGPANDGGYYLLGMNSYIPQVFDDMEWSTASVFSGTESRLKSLNKSVVILPELIDVDEFSDLQASTFDISKIF